MGERMTLSENVPTQIKGTGFDPTSQIKEMVSLLDEAGVNILNQTILPGGGCYLTASGCIGQMRFTDGSIIDVMPDITGKRGPSLESEALNKKALMYMLYAIFNIDIKEGVMEDLFEFFVRVYIDEVRKLISKGLRSAYTNIQGNEKSFKGRILFSENIRENFIHKERVYVEYELYSPDRAENRLIKRTLELLSRKSLNSRNRKDIKTILLDLEEIPSSTDIATDFDKCVIDRNMMDYITPMIWCNIFLKGMGLAGNGKGAVPFSLFLRTEDIFAAFVARMASKGRKDGAFSLRYDADILTRGDISSISVILVKTKWSYYDRTKDKAITDAESLFLSAPGYRIIPHGKGSRVKAMAGSYLADMKV